MPISNYTKKKVPKTLKIVEKPKPKAKPEPKKKLKVPKTLKIVEKKPEPKAMAPKKKVPKTLRIKEKKKPTPVMVDQPETELKKAKKIREKMDHLKSLLPLSKYKTWEDDGAGAGAGSSATYDREELESEIQPLRIKLLLADNNVAVGNIVGGDSNTAYKILKMTPANITYKKVGYRGRDNNLYLHLTDDAKELKSSNREFIADDLDLGSLTTTQYNWR